MSPLGNRDRLGDILAYALVPLGVRNPRGGFERDLTAFKDPRATRDPPINNGGCGMGVSSPGAFPHFIPVPCAVRGVRRYFEGPKDSISAQ